MGQGARWDRGDLFEGISLEYLHDIQSAHRHVSKLTTGVSNDVDVIGDGAGVNHSANAEWRTCVEYHRAADILERQPDLVAVGRPAMSRQNGLSCLTCPMILCPAVVMTTVSGLKLEQTYPCLPSGEKIVMPGPFGTVIRVFSLNVLPSRTAT